MTVTCVNIELLTKCNLACHIQSTHEGAKYEYNKCEYKAATQSYLIHYIQLEHEGAKYNCN